jgi:hypothetical protein
MQDKLYIQSFYHNTGTNEIEIILKNTNGIEIRIIHPEYKVQKNLIPILESLDLADIAYNNYIKDLLNC